MVWNTVCSREKSRWVNLWEARLNRMSKFPGGKKLCSAMRMLRMQGSQGESTANFRCSCTYCFLFPPTLACSQGSLACCKLTWKHLLSLSWRIFFLPAVFSFLLSKLQPGLEWAVLCMQPTALRIFASLSSLLPRKPTIQLSALTIYFHSAKHGALHSQIHALEH